MYLEDFAEGCGRTCAICACYLIYYYKMEAWDAIRIMRHQRPGLVERKVQEETVVMFYDLDFPFNRSWPLVPHIPDGIPRLHFEVVNQVADTYVTSSAATFSTMKSDSLQKS